MIGAWISTSFIQSKSRNAIYLCIMTPKHKTQLIWMSIREGNWKFLNFSIDSIALQIYIVCVTRHLSNLNRVRALSHGRLFSCQLPPQKIVRNRIRAFLRKHSHEQLFCGGHKKVASSCGRAHFSDHTIVVGNSWREWKPLFSMAAFTRATFRRTTFCNFLKVTASLSSTGTFFLIVVSWRLMKGPTFVRWWSNCSCDIRK